MNPNQPSNFQHYSPQLKPTQFINYQNPNQQQYIQGQLNIPRNNFPQGNSLIPPDNNQMNRNRLDRVMYSSSIETTLPNKNFAFGKL